MTKISKEIIDKYTKWMNRNQVYLIDWLIGVEHQH
jgi:hypothetical protein